MNKRRDNENGNNDRDDEGDNKASPSTQTPPPPTVNVTLSPLRRRPGRHFVTEKFKDAAVRLVDSGLSRLEIYRDDVDDDSRAEDQNDAASEEDDGDDNEDDGIRSTVPRRRLGEGPP